MIFCDTFEQLQLGPTTSFDRWFFEGHPPVELVERELVSAGIAFERREMPHEPSAFLLRLDSGVELLFSKGSDPMLWPGVPGLYGFQYADKTNPSLPFRIPTGFRPKAQGWRVLEPTLGMPKYSLQPQRGCASGVGQAPRLSRSGALARTHAKKQNSLEYAIRLKPDRIRPSDQLPTS